MVTGSTGFVGSHVCRQLLAAGHTVQALVRNVDKASAIFSAEQRSPTFFEGDVTDVQSIANAVAGCEAVVHAAAGTPMQIDSIEQLFAVNVGGVKNIVDTALAKGVSSIVCVSSITAIFDPDGSKVTPDAPPVPSSMPYGQSKVEAEHYLRALQKQGAPIAILYPGGVVGPDDPGFSDSCKAIKHRVENGFRIFGDGGMQYIDVRDLAALACGLVERGGAGRLLVPGVFATWTEQADTIEAVSGAHLQRIPAKGWKLRLVGRGIDVLRKFKTVDSPISAETMRYATLWPKIENTPLLNEYGVSLRPLEETFADTLRWMVQAGHLDAKHCPKFDR
ncbi:MAG: SDR family NAD(P)-dependent oxidoreductase [Halioglobus sp.]